MLAQEPSERLAAYVVWEPVLVNDGLPDAATLGLMPDSRAQHFWDQDGVLGPAFKELLRLPGRIQGWDLYLLYPAGAIWGSSPPSPAHWQHQLGAKVELLAPKLDGAETLREAARLLTNQPGGPFVVRLS